MAGRVDEPSRAPFGSRADRTHLPPLPRFGRVRHARDNGKAAARSAGPGEESVRVMREGAQCPGAAGGARLEPSYVQTLPSMHPLCVLGPLSPHPRPPPPPFCGLLPCPERGLVWEARHVPHPRPARSARLLRREEAPLLTPRPRGGRRPLWQGAPGSMEGAAFTSRDEGYSARPMPGGLIQVGPSGGDQTHLYPDGRDLGAADMGCGREVGRLPAPPLLGECCRSSDPARGVSRRGRGEASARQVERGASWVVVTVTVGM